MILKSKFNELFQKKENKSHRKTLIPVNTSCKQTAQFTDTAKRLNNGICVCATFDRPKISYLMTKLVTELYKSTISVVCDFQLPRMFLNLPCLACCDNTKSAVKSHKLYMSFYGGCFEKYIHFAL